MTGRRPFSGPTVGDVLAAIREHHPPPPRGVNPLVPSALSALVMRLLALGNKALLTDEGTSYAFSQLPIPTLLWRLCDPHPPGYSMFLRAVAVLGASE